MARKSTTELQTINKKFDPSKCGRRNKNCRNRKCGYKFKGGDMSLLCPECGTDRRCRNNKSDGYDVCRMHGAGGGRPPSNKYSIAKDLNAAYNRILQSPELLTLGQEIAVVGARLDQLHQMLDDNSSGIAQEDIQDALNIMEKGVITGVTALVTKGIETLRESMVSYAVHERIWAEISEKTELMRKMMESQHKFNKVYETMIPIKDVVELVSYIQRRTFQVVPGAKDRAELSRVFRKAVIPSENRIG